MTRSDTAAPFCTAIASFPRSGNTYFRKLLEACFHLETGTLHSGYGDWGQNRPDLSIQKTHFPWNGYKRNSHEHFKQFIYLIRNPFDCIYSTFVYSKDVDRKRVEWEPKFIEDCCALWVEHIDYWRAAATAKPALYVRFEDLLSDPYEWLSRTKEFLQLSASDIDLHGGIRRCSLDEMRKHFTKTMGARARSHIRSGEIFGSLGYYSAEDRAFVIGRTQRVLDSFNYVLPSSEP